LDEKLLQLLESRTLSGKEFQEDGAATATCICERYNTHFL